MFDELRDRYGEHGLIYYWRGEAHRASGRRKDAYADLVHAIGLLPDGEWRDRASQTARRVRSHHEPPPSR